MNKIRSTKKN